MAIEPDRMVVFAPNWVGDAVMFTPALRAIRTRFPRARIVLFARPAPGAVLTPNPWADEILVDRGGLLANVRALRARRFDLAVLANNYGRTGGGRPIPEPATLLLLVVGGRGLLEHPWPWGALLYVLLVLIGGPLLMFGGIRLAELVGAKLGKEPHRPQGD